MDRVLKNNILASEVAADIAMTTTAGGKAMTQKMRVASRGADRIKIEAREPVPMTMVMKDGEMRFRDHEGKVKRQKVEKGKNPAFAASGSALPSLADYRKSFEISLNEQLSDPKRQRWVLDWVPTESPPPFGRMRMTVDGKTWAIVASEVYDDRGSLMAESRMDGFMKVRGRWFATKTSTWAHTPQGITKLQIGYANVESTEDWPDSAFEVP